MPLLLAHKSTADKLNSLKQEAASLLRGVNTEGFIRFADHAWHLRDWIMTDPSVPRAAKDEASSFQHAPPIQALCICKDIINSHKHMEITRYTPSTEDASSNRGWGVGRYGEGGFGVGEEQISFTMKDGTRFDALEVVEAIVRFWDDFFIRHGIGRNQSSLHSADDNHS
jgi:hypothetical protein